ncbi:hypothetical protein Hdeb2414_s0014g00428761 [Helianthus debilis subsp. tardiflorus]
MVRAFSQKEASACCCCCCDYVVVSDTLKGLAPTVVRKPNLEPQDTADIPSSNPNEPIDLDSSPKPLVRTKAVKRKPESEAVVQPAKKVIRKRIGKKGNLDALVAKLSSEKPIASVRTESSSVFNDDLPPSPPRTSIKEQLEGIKAVEAKVEKAAEVKKTEVEVGRSVEVELKAEKVVEAETVDAGATKPKSPEVVAHESEKGKSIQEDPVITIPFFTTTSAPVNVEKSPAGADQGFFTHDEEDSPICPEETLGDYYYRSYSEKRASEIHARVWKLKQGDTFSDWKIFQDGLQGVFPPAEVKFQEDQTYHAYLEETASSTSTTYRIVREWHNMHKERAAFEASKKEVGEEKENVALLRAKLEADQAKFESEQKTEEWSAEGWKRKDESEAALLSGERERWREISEKDNNEKMGLRNNINNLEAKIEKLKKEKT